MMKFNKKIIVATLSTALGLGIVGSITGTVAWYSYNTRVSTSIIGVSAGHSGSVMFSLDNNNWSNRLMTNDIIKKVTNNPAATATEFDFEQVTFGEMGSQNALPAQAYLQPEAGMGGYNNWERANVNEHYLQFDLYVKALQDMGDGNGFVKKAKNIFLTDVTIEDPEGATTEIAEAVRIHISNKTVARNYLISKSTVTDLHLYSNTLDLDANGSIDKYGGKYEWDNALKDTDCMYGTDGDLQSTLSAATVTAAVDANGNVIDSSATNTDLFKATTVTDADPTNLHFVITMWLEGWHELETDTPIWSVLKTRAAQFHIGLTFDAGLDVFD